MTTEILKLSSEMLEAYPQHWSYLLGAEVAGKSHDIFFTIDVGLFPLTAIAKYFMMLIVAFCFGDKKDA